MELETRRLKLDSRKSGEIMSNVSHSLETTDWQEAVRKLDLSLRKVHEMKSIKRDECKRKQRKVNVIF